MKIGVISDTHGNVQALRRALEFFDGVDLIVHAGDVLYHPPRLGCTEGYDIPACVEILNSLDTPVVIAQGNCDAQVYEELLNIPVQSPYAYSNCDGMGILVNHGHLLIASRWSTSASATKRATSSPATRTFPTWRISDGLVLMNPGSPSIPKFEIRRQARPQRRHRHQKRREGDKYRGRIDDYRDDGLVPRAFCSMCLVLLE